MRLFLIITLGLVHCLIGSTGYSFDMYAKSCAFLFKEPLQKSTEVTFERDFRLSGISSVPEAMSQKEIARMSDWAKSKMVGSYLSLIESNRSNAREYVVYNWMEADINLRVASKGISKNDLDNILNKANTSHLGIYAMADPVSAAFFGDVLVEIAVYKDQVKPWQFGIDPTKGGGAGNMIEFGVASAFRTESYLIQDLRVIKQFRWPSKDMVLETWSATSKKNSSENLLKLGGQWLITPNYTAKERRSIMESNWPKLIDFKLRP